MRRVVLKINVPRYLLRTEPLLLLQHQEHEITCLLFRVNCPPPNQQSRPKTEMILSRKCIIVIFYICSDSTWEPFLNTTWALLKDISQKLFPLCSKTRFISHSLIFWLNSRCWRWKSVCQQRPPNSNSVARDEPHFVNHNCVFDLVLQLQISSITC